MTPVDELGLITVRLNTLAAALASALETGSGAEIDALLDERQPLLQRLRQLGLAHRELVLSDPSVRAMAAHEQELLAQAQRRRSELRRKLHDVRQKASLDREYGVA